MAHSEDKNNNGLAQTLLLGSIILKIIVVANANHDDAKACKVGYMYDYDRDSLIVTGILYGTMILVMWAGGIAAVSEAEGCVKMCFTSLVATIAGSLVAFVTLLGKVWHTNPNTTVLFYNTFWKSPVDCPSGIDSKWYDWAQVPLKYDAFAMMVCLLLLACGTCCIGSAWFFSLCSGEKKKNTDAVRIDALSNV
tara:strand:- start:686 stop:1267 length:582 start_codon:yes stop_codon:yes gene_type:complete